MRKFHERLREALSVAKMTQSELSQKTGISKSAISQYCAGSFAPKKDRVQVIAKALNISPAWLNGDDINVMEWRSTSHALPQLLPTGLPVEVIVAIAGASVATTLWFDGEHFADEAGDTYRVTHWMPLPMVPRTTPSRQTWRERMMHTFLNRG